MSEDKWDTMARERAINDASLEKLYRQRVHRLVEFADHPRIAEELRAALAHTERLRDILYEEVGGKLEEGAERRKYKGIRASDEPEAAIGKLRVFVVEGAFHRPLPMYLSVYAHSPSGFECGYEGSGPAQLALAILVEHMRTLGTCAVPDKLAVRLHQDFKSEIIARLPRDADFEIDIGQIYDWLDGKAAITFAYLAKEGASESGKPVH